MLISIKAHSLLFVAPIIIRILSNLGEVAMPVPCTAGPAPPLDMLSFLSPPSCVHSELSHLSPVLTNRPQTQLPIMTESCAHLHTRLQG